MLPFCGYNFGDYFQHWLDIGDHPGANLPKLFYVNWFRKMTTGISSGQDSAKNEGLKWVLERIGGTTEAVETAIGMVPKPEDLDVSGLDLKRRSSKPIGCK